ncbi:MAG: Endonuclease MutS2 [Firmicutes bacterium ADurb.Bin182]|nr:MAG: Endonuclease MutS2 [Firmicutes bacterium ADurb.Bin182]
MKEKILTLLEYDKIIELLALRAACCIGREKCERLRPLYGFREVEKLMELTAQAETVLIKTGRNPVDDFPDMRGALKRAHAAFALSPGELLGIMRCLRAVRLARESLSNRREDAPLLCDMASALSAHRSIEEEIGRCIIAEDEIADGASAELSRIRRDMRKANERVREKLQSIIHSSQHQKYLQDALITIRNGRFVIPVRQEYRQFVPGLIHDQSGSGATLFIEPIAVVELGNEYKRLQSEEADEIERILSELTALIAPHADELYEDLDALGELDLIFAKAAFSRELNAVRPVLNDKGIIRIIQGRHPLIASDRVVPVDIWLGKDFRTLIITGPNTGGKTVTLKTVGLFALMAQSGIFIPAHEGTEVGVFDNVFADIGDEQSIEQSLSTFSSHMLNIVGILNRAGGRSLVLLDELGAGTDPTEGAALAMSILTELHNRGTVTIATTHYSEIKAFALTRRGMENASMEFDVDRLCPTYRLFIGIPGKSNAFEISKRLGLDESVIESARGFLKNEDVRFEDVISNAESLRRVAEEERKMAQQARAELDKLREEAAQERQMLIEERANLRKKTREDAKKIIAGAKYETDRIISELKKAKELDRSSVDRAIQQARDALRKEEEGLDEPVQANEEAGTPPNTVRAGDTVNILSLKKKATVLSEPDSKGDVQVRAGIMKLTVKLSDLRLVKENPPNVKSETKVSFAADKKTGLELDIRGKLVDDAILEVDRFLDDAYMNGFSEVYIIHGKGTGALRAGIQNYLKHHPRVKSFRPGAYGEGDAGVTVAALK